MNILVLNCGSSSVKFQIIATDLSLIASNGDQRLARGNLERIGGEAIVSLQAFDHEKQLSTATLKDIRAAVEFIVRWAGSDDGPGAITSVADIHAVGHRVVHGGEHFKHSVLIDEKVIRAIEDCIELAPLHNPTNIKGIQAARDVLGSGLPDSQATRPKATMTSAAAACRFTLMSIPGGCQMRSIPGCLFPSFGLSM